MKKGNLSRFVNFPTSVGSFFVKKGCSISCAKYFRNAKVPPGQLGDLGFPKYLGHDMEQPTVFFLVKHKIFLSKRFDFSPNIPTYLILLKKIHFTTQWSILLQNVPFYSKIFHFTPKYPILPQNIPFYSKMFHFENNSIK